MKYASPLITHDITLWSFIPLILSIGFAYAFFRFFVPKSLAGLQVAFPTGPLRYEVHTITKDKKDAKELLRSPSMRFGVIAYTMALTGAIIIMIEFSLLQLRIISAYDSISLKFKILSQIFLALLGISLFVYFIDYQEITNLYFPFFKNLIINLGWFFIPFSVFVIVGSSNAVNLTDGLDGLATVPVILVASCFAFISYVTGNIVFSDYLQIPYIEGTGEVSIFCGAIIGSCLGFLWFNAPPAKIFMGDTGSLALGGSLGAVGIITKHEIVLAITGGLFVLEAVSVMVQVISFKLTGKRIFRMAPIHHHFEKKGWPESTVVIRFWIISIILAMIGLATLKLR